MKKILKKLKDEVLLSMLLLTILLIVDGALVMTGITTNLNFLKEILDILILIFWGLLAFILILFAFIYFIYVTS